MLGQRYADTHAHADIDAHPHADTDTDTDTDSDTDSDGEPDRFGAGLGTRCGVQDGRRGDLQRRRLQLPAVAHLAGGLGAAERAGPLARPVGLAVERLLLASPRKRVRWGGPTMSARSTVMPRLLN
jgi:hypothetical protein